AAAEGPDVKTQSPNPLLLPRFAHMWVTWERAGADTEAQEPMTGTVGWLRDGFGYAKVALCGHRSWSCTQADRRVSPTSPASAATLSPGPATACSTCSSRTRPRAWRSSNSERAPTKT